MEIFIRISRAIPKQISGGLLESVQISEGGSGKISLKTIMKEFPGKKTENFLDESLSTLKVILGGILEGTHGNIPEKDS